MKSLVPRFTGCCFVLLLLTLQSGGCSFAFGYFHQVTQLKGKIVGRSLGPVQFQWLRRMFSVAGAELTLYDYKHPFHWDHKPPAVVRTKTNSAGEFEFKDVKEGHYTLEIEGGGFDEFFDVEVTKKLPPTAWITIDVSPTSPDCSGGHQFEVQPAKK
ncbi:MAG TPA: carboxypeptidase-like regulatory domain-containing protein [Candidatus Angelobacter sp.]